MTEFGAAAMAGPPDDRLGAFCRDNHIAVAGSGTGPLSGLVFAAKDVFDVAGAATGNGHPDWLRTHAPATRTAPAVQRMLDAGADLVGKTVSDELVYSLTGENFHYGTPLNPVDPARVPGGSSSGSASAVAAGVVDFALGTDCGGSVRVPASYCGIYGMRPTHGAVPLEGVVPFAPSFDCAGWFARDAQMLARVGRVLLDDRRSAAPFRRVVLAVDGFAMLEPALQRALQPAVGRVEQAVGPAQRMTLSDEGLDVWSEVFRTLQAAEIWTSLGSWIEQVQPTFGPGVRERFEAASVVDSAAVSTAAEQRTAIVARLTSLLDDETVLLLPTVPRVAPKRNSPIEDVEVAYRHAAMGLLCVAGLAGLPQISLPLTAAEGLPLGLSILAARGRDVDLLALATRLSIATV